ncbi:hypothetical protein [Campylobacter sp. CN_NA1]|uniref:hypothetical protein n=1 Tax=Campylobacter sp. CN_NA1 TaxID=2984150 RepID=UPI0022E9F040|nr:hypothetical protein [Campylobacter sp. CN_NA1]MDA3056452.1 hypothetical protein [Campylobacter sp. CN_NA1]
MKISDNYKNVLMYRVLRERVPSFKKLEKLKSVAPKFVKEHAKRAILAYKELQK